MHVEKETSNDAAHGVEGSEIRVSNPDSDQNSGNPDPKIGFSEKGFEFFRESEVGFSGFGSRNSGPVNSCSQELTLRYLCENSKMGFSDSDFSSKGSFNFKGKNVMLEQEERWVERDFLHLSESKGGGGSSKREFDEESDRRKDKNPRIEALKLSLALPDVSLYLAASNAMQQNVDPAPPVRPRPTRSVQSLAPSGNDTQTMYSNDFTAASLSYSHSHAFSHNPSCSLTRNSTDFNEYSMGTHRRDNDQIWNCGEGTNGSVHSRFRPVGDGVTLSNHGGGVFALMNGGRGLNRDPSNSVFRAAGSETTSFFPSELPARPRLDTVSEDSRARAMEHMKGSDNLEGRGTHNTVSRPERILQDIVSESIPVMAQIIQEVSDETTESTKSYLKNLIAAAGSKHDLVSLQRKLDRRSDLSRETLSKAHRVQLEILVAIKFGVEDYVSGKFRLPTSELIEIFSLMRCRNVNCKSVLPVDDCDCKICSGTKGFCSQCMCPVCMKFDCANNTCSWVGCDVCSHWCHAACGIEKNLIRPGPSLKGLSGTTEMQFHCLGCSHASEMFGFVKDVFKYCAKNWGLQTMIKELSCVEKIFQGSIDVRGQQLHSKAAEIISKLEMGTVSPSDACSYLIQFFNGAESTSNLPVSSNIKKETAGEAGIVKETTPKSPKPITFNPSSSATLRDMVSHGERNNSFNSSRGEDDSLLGLSVFKKDTYDGMEGIIRIKEAESRLFQKRADEARKEADVYRRLVRARTEKLEEEYSEKLAKLCLQKTEERRKKKMEELKLLESSHCDYFNMKIRMQAEIAGLLERMEATKQQWV